MNKNKQIQNHWMRFKVSTLTASITSLILAGLPAQIQASDIDIYQAGGTGTTKIYMMLDKSGSMNHVDYMAIDYGNRVVSGSRVCSRSNNMTYIDGTLYNSLKEGGYNYTVENEDMYCQVDISKTFETDNTNYKEKIKKLCELQSGTTYNCYSRIIKLRQGLISLILDPSIGKDIQLGLGVYSGSSASNLQDFLAMDPDTSNKDTLIKKVQKIKAGGGTPIATAYNFAGQVYVNTTGNSNTTESCTGNGIYFLTDGTPEGDSANFSYPTSLIKKTDKNLSSGTYWKEIGYYAQSIRAHNKKVKTATVGFGGGISPLIMLLLRKAIKSILIALKLALQIVMKETYVYGGLKQFPMATGMKEVLVREVFIQHKLLLISLKV